LHGLTMIVARHPELVSGSPAIKGDAETSSARRYKKICVISVICGSDRKETNSQKIFSNTSKWD